MKQYVIIGNGVAAVGCIEGIRSLDKTGRITVVSGEARPAYCRPLISYYLEGRTDPARMQYRPTDFYAENGCTVLSGVQAVQLDAQARTVLLGDGRQLPYDALCAAMGAAPFVPDFDGLDSVPDKFTFNTFDDALALEQKLSEKARVLIVGAGLSGLKCAEALAHRAGSVTVCDLADRVLSSILDAECARLLQERLEAHGVRFLLGDSPARFARDTAFLQSGLSLGFDILVLAVGVRPSISLIRDAGGETGRGILTDVHMASSLPDVYAAGDCAENFDVSSGARKVLGTFPAACMQGRCAGVNMAGGAEEFQNAAVMNSIGFFGLHAMTTGSCFSPEQGGEVSEIRTEKGLRRLYSKDGFLTGFRIVGDTAGTGIYTRLIRERVKLDSIDYEAVKKNPSLLPFGAEYRGKVLGGVV